MSELNLNGTKLKVLVDKLTVLPEIATKATTRGSIVKGFRASGLIDPDLSKYPVFRDILGTRRPSMPTDLYNSLQDIDYFKKLFDITLKNGHISEQVYDELGFPKDVDPHGNIVARDATISQESYQRAKRVNHPEQVRLREQRVQQIRTEERRVAESKRESKQKQIDIINKIRGRLLDPDDHPEVEGEMDNCSLEQFAKLSAKELIEFIVAYDPDFPTKSSITKSGMVKGDKDSEMKAAYEALENGTPSSIFNTKILAAYRCRNNDCKFDLQPLPLLPPVTATVEYEVNSSFVDVMVDGRECEGVLPSELLDTTGAWLGVSCELFHIDELIENLIICVTDEMKEKADLLVKILRSRMNFMLESRNVSKDRREHWAIKLAFKNLSVVAAYMILCQHVKEDLLCLDEQKSLLTSDTGKFIQCQDHSERIGSYLYFCINDWQWIRSGKVSGQGFGDRHKEHLVQARRDEIPDSMFYRCYPTRDSKRVGSITQRGIFDNLTQYIAAGFDGNCEIAACADKSYDEGGILVMNDNEKQQIKSSMKQTKNVIAKFHAYLAYLMEFGYDLALSPAHNVSESFGFEGFVGLFGAV